MWVWCKLKVNRNDDDDAMMGTHFIKTKHKQTGPWRLVVWVEPGQRRAVAGGKRERAGGGKRASIGLVTWGLGSV